MKPAVGVVLFAVVFICSGASAQKGRGRCPANNVVGICIYNPDVNCLDDSVCKGGQICCPQGCNSVCSDPETDGPSKNQQSGGWGSPNNRPSGQQPQPTVRQCPQPSGQFGICSYDENVNCLSDDECKNGQMCCSEGCNKVCKDPVTFQPKVPTSGRRQQF